MGQGAWQAIEDPVTLAKRPERTAGLSDGEGMCPLCDRMSCIVRLVLHGSPIYPGDVESVGQWE